MLANARRGDFLAQYALGENCHRGEGGCGRDDAEALKPYLLAAAQDDAPGSRHPFLMKKAGFRTVPIRANIENRLEAIAILKQMEIPKWAWPENLR